MGDAETTALLLVEQAGEGGRRATVDKAQFTIGRATGMDLQIDDRIVSSRHAVIRRSGQEWILEDLGSTNGTYINGERIDSPRVLREDDLVHFARMAFRVARPGQATTRGDTLFMPNQSDIRGSLDLVEVMDRRGAFSVFQPIVDLGTGRPIAWEALGRGVARGERLSPARMFDMAEKARSTSKLSRSLCAAALECLACGHCWAAEGATAIWINLHPSQIVDGRLEADLHAIAEAAAQTGFRAVIEAPETWVNLSDEMRSLVDLVRRLGMGVAYDDFGAGQSRLQDLISVPPDYLKFDRCLVRNLQGDRVKQEIVQAIVRACDQLGVSTLAEGIEEEGELQACRELGIGLGQGFLLARPVQAFELFDAPRDELPALCQHRRLGVL